MIPVLIGVATSLSSDRGHLHGAWRFWSVSMISEEIGHIFCARDYALRLNGNNCVFYVPNFASLVPKSIWPGTEGERKLPTRSEATVGG